MKRDGSDPAHTYVGGTGFEGCQNRCIERSDCFGFSVSSYGNCLMWLSEDIMGGGINWGEAECFIRSDVLFTTSAPAGNTSNLNFAKNREYITNFQNRDAHVKMLAGITPL